MKDPIEEDRFCSKHGMDVKPFFSKKKNKWYCLHTFPNPVSGEIETCWVNSDEENDGFREKQVDYGMDNMIGVEKNEEGRWVEND